MLFKHSTFISFFAPIASSLLLLSSASAQSSIAVRITENDLNETVKDIRISGTEQRRFSSGFRFIPDISVTADWWVRDIRLDINRDQIIVTVKAHVKNGGNTRIPFSYTYDVSGEGSARIEENKLLLDITSLEVPIYAKNPFSNNRVELTKIDLVNHLGKRTISLDLPLQENYTVNIPQGGMKKLVLGNKILQIENDYISVKSDFSISD